MSSTPAYFWYIGKLLVSLSSSAARSSWTTSLLPYWWRNPLKQSGRLGTLSCPRLYQPFINLYIAFDDNCKFVIYLLASFTCIMSDESHCSTNWQHCQPLQYISVSVAVAGKLYVYEGTNLFLHLSLSYSDVHHHSKLGFFHNGLALNSDKTELPIYLIGTSF